MFLNKNKIIWVYGVINSPDGNIDPARINILTGEVQFKLWKNGEQGHKNGYWCRVGDGWDNYFVKTSSTGDSTSE